VTSTTLRSPTPNPQPDPLIDTGGEVTVYVGSFILILGIAAIVGVFSRRVEHALFTAFVLSIIPIAVFIFSKH
jgi:uncharacterized membrane protein HdeD (DUF308 family)